MVFYLKLVNKLNLLLYRFMGALFAIIVIVVFLQVLARYALPFSFVWGEELARYGIILIVLVAAGIAVRRNELISIDVIFDVVKNEKMKKILHLFLSSTIILFSIVLLTQGYEFLSRVQNQLSPALQLPMSIPYASIVIGSVVMLVNAVASIFEIIIGREVD